jgi:tetratricopeptide (TPR) repeat protein
LSSAKYCPLDRALRERPNLAQALDDKGLVLDNLGNHTGALQYFDRAIAANPKDSNSFYNKALSLQKMGLLSAAIGNYQKALAITQDQDTITNFGIAVCQRLYAEGNYTGAL